jgi:dolichyl-phosphate-mannose--protein O-mannosyl transferase
MISTTDNKWVEKDIEQTIKELYNSELPNAQEQDISTQNFQSKIIEMHYNISQMVNSLDKTKEIAEKVCNSQATWEWNCETN